MATYECSICGMSVNATCGKCNETLIDDTIEVDGSDVQVSKCPNDHGKIKSQYVVDKIWFVMFRIIQSIFLSYFLRQPF